MRKLITTFIVILTLFTFSTNGQDQINVNRSETELNSSKKIQLVFCLDATGSMGGLIDAAKQKIWSIASTLLQAKPEPDLEIGMIFYRDRGDEFVTRRILFTKNLDSLYDGLMEIRATGGGDSPESVNQALHEAVNLYQWSADTSVYKAIFLVGDCPPHMDYKNDVKYPVTCRLAIQSDIVINTLQMGNCQGAKPIWTEIASFTGGDYISVDNRANGYVLSTPCDKEIARLQNIIDNTVIYYGNSTLRIEKEKEIVRANKIYSKAKSSEVASRAEYKKTKGIAHDKYYRHDLVKDVSDGKVKIDTIREEHLPDLLKGKTLEEKNTLVLKMKESRDSAQQSLDSVMVKRNEFIKEKMKNEEDESKSSFSNKVYESMKKQSAKKGLILKEKVKE
ncbi:MAG: VWA domain-containing protein [Flavobacteriales bacterium]|nr:VWA domain-containing protein [Flavobacteriales bacterium]